MTEVLIEGGYFWNSLSLEVVETGSLGILKVEINTSFKGQEIEAGGEVVQMWS